MKKTTMILPLLGLLALAGNAQAHRGGPGGRGGPRMEEFDTNGDGKLDDTERAARHAQMQARHAEALARFDANKDGKLEGSERDALHAERAAEVFKQLDADGNGALSLDEFKAGRPGRGPRGR